MSATEPEQEVKLPRKYYPKPTHLVLILVIAVCGASLIFPIFLRAHRISQRNQCQENLAKIDGAKQQWAFEKIAKASDAPSWSDLIREDFYLQNSPSCPGGGQYYIGLITEDPSCSLSSQTEFPHGVHDCGAS